MKITECALYGEDPSIHLRKEGEAQKDRNANIYHTKEKMFLHFYISASSSSQLHAYQTSISLPNSQATPGCKLIAKPLKTNKPTKAPEFWSP